MITHAAQITFNDVISVETQREYDDCLAIIKASGEKFSYWDKRYQNKNLQYPIIYRNCGGEITATDVQNDSDRITPASYFIEANRGLLGETKK